MGLGCSGPDMRMGERALLARVPLGQHGWGDALGLEVCVHTAHDGEQHVTEDVLWMWRVGGLERERDEGRSAESADVRERAQL